MDGGYLVARLQSTYDRLRWSGPQKWLSITAILRFFFNPEIPGLSHGNPGISGLAKWTGIPGSRDTGSRDCNPYAGRYLDRLVY